MLPDFGYIVHLYGLNLWYHTTVVFVLIEAGTRGLDSTRGGHLYHLHKLHSVLHTGPLLLYCAFFLPAHFRGGDGSVRHSRARSNPCVLRFRPKLSITARVRQCSVALPAPPHLLVYGLTPYYCRCRYCQPHVHGLRLRYDLPCVARHNPPMLVATSRAFSRACTMHGSVCNSTPSACTFLVHVDLVSVTINTVLLIQCCVVYYCSFDRIINSLFRKRHGRALGCSTWRVMPAGVSIGVTYVKTLPR